MEWQPIKTAPKDGTWILVSRGDMMPDVVRWHKEKPNPCPSKEREYWRTADSNRSLGTATHWMALPKPPAN